ncbi:MAG: DNA repair protein RadC [Proteobacteria bacterium]|nr:DNA repair protein RadC [Pseudomonadota bacterium]
MPHALSLPDHRRDPDPDTPSHGRVRRVAEATGAKAPLACPAGRGGATGPREKLAMRGPGSLSDVELVAVLLGTGGAGEPVSIAAARLLQRVGSIAALHHFGVAALSGQTGVGLTKACRLKAAVELGRRSLAVTLPRSEPIRSSRQVAQALSPRLATEQREHFLALALDGRNRPLAELDVAVGGLTACSVQPTDVFRLLLREACASVVFVHNHPSGTCAPSEDDRAITERLRTAGELLGLGVLDHIIVAREGYFSFADAGLL